MVNYMREEITNFKEEEKEMKIEKLSVWL